MASSNSQSSPPSLEELSFRGAISFLIPGILNGMEGEVGVIVHQPTQSITVVEGSLESLFQEIQLRQGPRPATKDSIEALPKVQVLEPGQECLICLLEYEVDHEVKQMPCNHKFHSDCIDKWLEIHGSCPVCRFGMPQENMKIYEEGELRIHMFISRERTQSGYE